jgi:hypothetical protein
MGLRDQAAADLKFILEDSAAGFGWPITVVDPFGSQADLIGYSTDIAETIDASTGLAVSGREAAVTVAMASLKAAGFDELPRNVPEKTTRPWCVIFNDIAGASYKFKVSECRPDRVIGAILLILEAYEA